MIAPAMRLLRAITSMALPDRVEWRVLPRPLVLMAIYALLVRAGFPPIEAPVLALVGITLFVWYFGKLRRYITLRTGWWLGFAFGYVYFYTSAFWLHELVRYHTLIPPALVLLAAVQALWIGLVGVGMAWTARRAPEWLPLSAASLWTLAEWGRGAGELGFPFFRIGHLFWQTPGLAAWWGDLGLTFLTVLFCGGVGYLMLNFIFLPGFYRRGTVVAWGVQMAIGAAMLLVPALSPRPWLSIPTAPVTMALVQPNIAQTRKMEVSMERLDVLRYELARQIQRETFAVIERMPPRLAEVVIFPEATFPAVSLQFDANLQAKVFEAGRRLGAQMVIGADYWEKPGTDSERVYNAVFMIDPAQEAATGIYRKRHLVPFGEHVPFFDMIPGFQDIVVAIGSFNKGTGAQLLRFRGRSHPHVRIGILLCFESAVARLARESLAEGANLLAVTTNDGWFERSSGLHYHFIHCAFRAAETGLPVVQAANTGITGAFDATGRLVASIEPHQAGYLLATLDLPMRAPSPAEMTPYGRRGDAWLLSLLVLLAGIAGRGWWRPGVLRMA